MRHTPGPWVQDPTGDIGWWLIGTAEREVAEARGEDRFSGMTAGEARANARLIAAAPDLLAALKELVDWQGVEHQAAAGPDGDAEDCPGDDTCRCPIVAQVNAAIAKAEGR